LDFEGVHSNTALGNDEAEEVPYGDIENALEGIQADVVMTTPLEDDSQIIIIINYFILH
jgi:hypothetical protein